MIVQGRWWWTARRDRLVTEGDPEAAFLGYPDGAEVADAEARRVGLIPPARALRAGRRPSDKMAARPADK